MVHQKPPIDEIGGFLFVHLINDVRFQFLCFSTILALP